MGWMGAYRLLQWGKPDRGRQCIHKKLLEASLLVRNKVSLLSLFRKLKLILTENKVRKFEIFIVFFC